MSQLKAQKIGKLVEPVVTWHPLKADHDDEFDYIDISAVDQDTKTITAPRKILCREAPSRARQIVSANDVLVSTVRPNLNGVARVTTALDQATASTGFCVLRPRSALLSSSYLFHWVKSPQFVADMTKKATGQIYPAVSDKIISESLIPVPHLPEQIRIAAILDQADALRVKRRVALAQLDRLKQAIFIEMFGDPETNPYKWDLAPLGSQVQLQGGFAFKSSDYISDGVRLLKISNVHKDNLTWDDVDYLSHRHLDEYHSFELMEGDIVIALTRPIIKSLDSVKIAVVSHADTPCLLNQRVGRFVFRENSRIGPEYLLDFCRSTTFSNAVRRFCSVSLQPNMSTSQVESLEIPVPPKAQQASYVKRIKVIERLIFKHHESKVYLDFLFASLQHRAFSGEL